jgi:hypothetical protein
MQWQPFVDQDECHPWRIRWHGVQYSTFAIPFLSGFSGNSNGWKQSYFDLSDFAGKEITFRFRFGSDLADAPVDGAWYIDEVEIMDSVQLCGRGLHHCRWRRSSLRKRSRVRRIIVQPVTVGTDEPNQALQSRCWCSPTLPTIC